MLYNVYCDETCHLEHDGINDMVIGAIWCPQNKLKSILRRGDGSFVLIQHHIQHILGLL